MVEKSHKGDEWHAKLCTAPYVLSTTNSVQGVRALSREYDTSRQQHQFWRILITLFVNKSHKNVSELSTLTVSSTLTPRKNITPIVGTCLVPR